MDQSDIKMLCEPQEVSMGDAWFSIASIDHFWLAWRYQVLNKVLHSVIKPEMKILEVGCGNSCFRRKLEEDFDVAVDGCDLNLYALKKGEKGRGEIFVYDVYEPHEDLIEKYDVLFLLDVIEHVEDDVKFVQYCQKLLKPGGVLIINVPFSMNFYSNYDKAVGHLRRYHKNDLEKVVSSAGLTLRGFTLWGILLVPIALLRKIVVSFIKNDDDVVRVGFKPPHFIVETILNLLRKIEGILPFSQPVGTSIVCVSEKL